MRKEFESPERFTAQLAEVGGFLSRACSFTGHRPQKFPWRYNESDPACVALKETLAGQISRLYETGYTEFLTGMALGVDYEKRKVMRSEILCALYENENQKNHFA